MLMWFYLLKINNIILFTDVNYHLFMRLLWTCRDQTCQTFGLSCCCWRFTSEEQSRLGVCVYPSSPRTAINSCLVISPVQVLPKHLASWQRLRVIRPQHVRNLRTDNPLNLCSCFKNFIMSVKYYVTMLTLCLAEAV